jgi:hypothetical protein
LGCITHTNQYEKADTLFKGIENNIKLPPWDLMNYFGTEKPYQIQWGGKKETSVPFLVSEPLPVVQVEVNGRTVYAILDTGAWDFILDTEIAAELGIEIVSSAAGTFGGGKTMDVGFAKIEQLQIGDVIMKSVPISTLPTKRFSEGLTNNEYTIGGVIGTCVLKQFLSTVDYLRGELVLRPKDRDYEVFLKQMEDKHIVKVPFVLAELHKMIIRGRLNDFNQLTFFVDCGLANKEGAAFIAPTQTLTFVGIPIPEKTNFDGMGGGEGTYATGLFPIQKLSMGPLVQEDLLGSYGPLTEEEYWTEEMYFIVDGIISHNLLKKYSWTIDFNKMEMVFIW